MRGWVDTGNTAAVRAFMRGDIAGTKEVCANSERDRVRSFGCLTRGYKSEMNEEWEKGSASKGVND